MGIGGSTPPSIGGSTPPIPFATAQALYGYIWGTLPYVKLVKKIEIQPLFDFQKCHQKNRTKIMFAKLFFYFIDIKT